MDVHQIHRHNVDEVIERAILPGINKLYNTRRIHRLPNNQRLDGRWIIQDASMEVAKLTKQGDGGYLYQRLRAALDGVAQRVLHDDFRTVTMSLTFDRSGLARLAEVWEDHDSYVEKLRNMIEVNWAQGQSNPAVLSISRRCLAEHLLFNPQSGYNAALHSAFINQYRYKCGVWLEPGNAERLRVSHLLRPLLSDTAELYNGLVSKCCASRRPKVADSSKIYPTHDRLAAALGISDNGYKSGFADVKNGDVVEIIGGVASPKDALAVRIVRNGGVICIGRDGVFQPDNPPPDDSRQRTWKCWACIDTVLRTPEGSDEYKDMLMYASIALCPLCVLCPLRAFACRPNPQSSLFPLVAGMTGRHDWREFLTNDVASFLYSPRCSLEKEAAAAATVAAAIISRIATAAGNDGPVASDNASDTAANSDCDENEDGYEEEEDAPSRDSEEVPGL